MELLLTINENNFEPQNYSIRKVVRSLILDETETKILFFGGMIVGGGVEEGETDEEALAREAMEEVGARIEIIKPLGEVVAFRDYLKKKYIVHGYLCKIVGQLEKPTSIDPEEQNTKPVWIDIQGSIKKMEDEIESLLTETDPIQDDIFQRRIYNRKISLTFLKEL